MKNFIQSDDTITIPAPAGGAVSGQFVVVGALFGVSNNTAAAGDDMVLDLEGVFDLPKAAVAITVGAKLYFDATAGLMTTVVTGNLLVGAAVAAAAISDTAVRMVIVTMVGN